MAAGLALKPLPALLQSPLPIVLGRAAAVGNRTLRRVSGTGLDVEPGAVGHESDGLLVAGYGEP